MLVLNSLTYGIYVLIALCCGSLVHVANVHYRLVGKQVEVFCHGGFFVVIKLYAAAALSLKQGGTIPFQQVHKLFSLFVRTNLSLLLHVMK